MKFRHSNIITWSSVETGAGLSSSEISTLPPLHDLDMTVIKSLPPEVFSEINDMYDGKLFDFVSENKGKIVNTSIICDASLSGVGKDFIFFVTVGFVFVSFLWEFSLVLGIKFDEKESCHAHPVKSNTTAVGNEV